MINCKICKISFSNNRKLSKHIRDNHGTIKFYFDKFKKSKEGRCKVCYKSTKFLGLNGYAITCSHKCGGIYSRKNLKTNKITFNKFKNKVSKNQVKIWKTRNFKERENIFLKISNTAKKNLKRMSKEEILKKFSRYHTCSKKEIDRLNEIGKNQCLENFRLGRSGFKHVHKGKFKPRNINKYRGDVNNIIYRSSYELIVMIYLDKHPDVIAWASEEVIIQYQNPFDNSWHRYFVDFWVKFKNKEGKIQIKLLEIKPLKETVEPVRSEKKSKKTLLYEYTTYAINQSKWAAARKFCAENGWDFQILTEKEIGVMR